MTVLLHPLDKLARLALVAALGQAFYGADEQGAFVVVVDCTLDIALVDLKKGGRGCHCTCAFVLGMYRRKVNGLGNLDGFGTEHFGEFELNNSVVQRVAERHEKKKDKE